MSQIRDVQQHLNVEIAVRNFGPIAEATIDLRPLTVFIGIREGVLKEKGELRKKSGGPRKLAITG